MHLLAHKIQLSVKKDQVEYFSKAFGCARLAYNFCVGAFRENYNAYVEAKKKAEEAGETISKERIKELLPNGLELKKRFNAQKKEKYPFVYELSKYVVQQPFIYAQRGMNAFLKGLKEGKKVGYPKFKRKHGGQDSFYIGGDHLQFSEFNPDLSPDQMPTKPSKRQYIHLPKLGWVKMMERLRFNGKVQGAVFSRSGSKYFVSIQVLIDDVELVRTHRWLNKGTGEEAVAIDGGLKKKATLSNGVQIKNIRAYKKLQKALKREQRKLSRCVHPKTKEDREKGVVASKNYIKQAKKVANIHRKIKNLRNDDSHKMTTAISSCYKYVVVETLNLKGMLKNHCLAMSLGDAALGEMYRQIDYKLSFHGGTMLKAPRWYPSTKRCSCCGALKTKDQIPLSERTYRCEHCGLVLDRDYNASLNLLRWAQDVGGIGQAHLSLNSRLRECLDTNSVAYNIVAGGETSGTSLDAKETVGEIQSCDTGK